MYFHERKHVYLIIVAKKFIVKIWNWQYDGIALGCHLAQSIQQAITWANDAPWFNTKTIFSGMGIPILNSSQLPNCVVSIWPVSDKNITFIVINIRM